MGNASVSTHSAVAAPWPHAVIQNAAATLFAEAAARSAPADAETGANEAAAQAPRSALGNTAPASAQPGAAEDIAGAMTVSALPARHDVGPASQVQLPAKTLEGDSGSSKSNALAQASKELRPDGTAAGAWPATPREGPELALVDAPAAGDTAGASARTASAAPAAAPATMATGNVNVTMSMWQIYCDAAQDLLAPGAPALRGRSMEGLRRVRVTSAADVEVRSTRCMEQVSSHLVHLSACALQTQ